jgi:D-arabinose 1-dehydrogenase-like Zn-dependent alcohol dehydrogenase
VTQNVSTPAQAVREGEIIAGKYRVERVLGVGGMGVVAVHRAGLAAVTIAVVLISTSARADARPLHLRILRANGGRVA